MSALGQKRTYAAHKVMSALPSIATAKAKFRKRPCPLYPQKRTCAVQLGMSALGQKRTHAAQQRRSLFDHLVGLLFLRYGRNGRRTHSGELHDHLTVFRPDIMRRAFWLGKECARGIGLELRIIPLFAYSEIVCP